MTARDWFSRWMSAGKTEVLCLVNEKCVMMRDLSNQNDVGCYGSCEVF